MAGARYFDHPQSNRIRTATEHVNLRLPVDLLERLAAVGRDEGLGMSDTIRLVLERGLAKSRRKAP
jgi:hypothetical protein